MVLALSLPRALAIDIIMNLGLLSFSPSPPYASSAAARRQFTILVPTFHPRFLRHPTVCPSPRALLLPRYSLGSGSAAALLQDASATAAVLFGAYSLVFTLDTLTRHELIQQKLSRKLVHILSGLLFMASWPLFSNSTAARYFASFVPVINCLRLLINGFSLATDDGLVKSVTREGNPEELLRGPLYYVLVLIFCVIIFWRESPAGIITLAMMCGGDGIADIAGRRFGSQKLPYNQQKSWAGSISMFAFGFSISMGMLYYFSSLGYFQLDWVHTIQRVALISLLATVVESVPATEVIDDNISVPIATMIAAFLSFGY